MSEPIWLGLDLVIDIHSEQLALFGGPDGLRDRGLLESALARPINKHAYGDFLGLNGMTFRVDPAQATASVLALAAGEIDEAGFARWVRDSLPKS